MSKRSKLERHRRRKSDGGSSVVTRDAFRSCYEDMFDRKANKYF